MCVVAQKIINRVLYVECCEVLHAEILLLNNGNICQ